MDHLEDKLFRFFQVASYVLTGLLIVMCVIK